MYKLILVDDNKEFASGLKDRIRLETDEYFTVEKVIYHPAQYGDIERGALIAYLNLKEDDFTAGKLCYILLDLTFGKAPNDYGLGVKVANYLLHQFKYRHLIRIMAITNHDDQVYFRRLNQIGVKVIVHKTHLTTGLSKALNSLVNNQPYSGDIYFEHTAKADWIPKLRRYVAKQVARGFSVKALEQLDNPLDKGRKLTSAKQLKSLVKNESLVLFFEELSNEGHPDIPRFSEPQDDYKEWSDVAFLLYKLRIGDEEIIEYVQRVCKIRIEVPANRNGNPLNPNYS